MNALRSHKNRRLTASCLLSPSYIPSSQSSGSGPSCFSRSSVTEGKFRSRCSELNEKRRVCTRPEAERPNASDEEGARCGTQGESLSGSGEIIVTSGSSDPGVVRPGSTRHVLGTSDIFVASPPMSATAKPYGLQNWALSRYRCCLDRLLVAHPQNRMRSTRAQSLVSSISTWVRYSAAERACLCHYLATKSSLKLKL